MHMRTTFQNVKVYMSLMLLFLLPAVIGGDESDVQPITFTKIADALDDANAGSNALGGLLFELAGAQYHQDLDAKRRRIMTTHRGKSVLAFTDGKIAIVSLPFSNQAER